jgi:hypothetical protein
MNFFVEYLWYPYPTLVPVPGGTTPGGFRRNELISKELGSAGALGIIAGLREVREFRVGSAGTLVVPAVIRVVLTEMRR